MKILPLKDDELVMSLKKRTLKNVEKKNGGSPYFVGVTSMAGLNFLLKCNYDTKHFKDLLVF